MDWFGQIIIYLLQLLWYILKYPIIILLIIAIFFYIIIRIEDKIKKSKTETKQIVNGSEYNMNEQIDFPSINSIISEINEYLDKRTLHHVNFYSCSSICIDICTVDPYNYFSYKSGNIIHRETSGKTEDLPRICVYMRDRLGDRCVITKSYGYNPQDYDIHYENLLVLELSKAEIQRIRNDNVIKEITDYYISKSKLYSMIQSLFRYEYTLPNVVKISPTAIFVGDSPHMISYKKIDLLEGNHVSLNHLQVISIMNVIDIVVSNIGTYDLILYPGSSNVFSLGPGYFDANENYIINNEKTTHGEELQYSTIYDWIMTKKTIYTRESLETW